MDPKLCPQCISDASTDALHYSPTLPSPPSSLIRSSYLPLISEEEAIREAIEAVEIHISHLVSSLHHHVLRMVPDVHAQSQVLEFGDHSEPSEQKIVSFLCERCGRSVGSAGSAGKVSRFQERRALLIKDDLQPADDETLCEDDFQAYYRVYDDLRNQSEKLRGFVDRQKCLLSPIRRVPVDVLQTIFLLCRETPGSRNTFAVTTNSFMWRLCQVCSHWRAVATSTSILWSSIFLPFLRPTATLSEHLKKLSLFTARCLEFSGDTPLTLDFGCASHAEIVEILLPHAHRWKDVNLQMDIFADPFGQAEISFPILEILRLRGWEERSAGLHLFENAPNLTTLELGFTLDPVNMLHLPWKQIKHYNTVRSTYSDGQSLFKALMNMPNLEILEISRDLTRKAFENKTAMTFPHLIALVIDLGCQDIADFFPLLTLPALTNLSIETTVTRSFGATPIEIATPTISLIRRSLVSHSLTVLSLKAIEDSQVLQVLHEVPGLLSLELRASNRLIFLSEIAKAQQYSMILGELAKSQRNGGGLLPNLKRLQFKDLATTTHLLALIHSINSSLTNGSRDTLPHLVSIILSYRESECYDKASLAPVILAGKAAGLTVDIVVDG